MSINERSIWRGGLQSRLDIFLLNESGKLAVLQAGQDWRVLAVNDLGESCYATPAIAAGVIVVRSEQTLWAFPQNKERPLWDTQIKADAKAGKLEIRP